MATYNGIKKIKIGDNIFNLYDSGNSGGTITRVKTTAGAHATIDVSSGTASFNVPTHTSHLTNNSGFLTSHQTLYEANLNWGGKDFSASYGPVDAAMIDVLGANRFAFLKAAGLTIEYSTDGGSSYTDYGATDAQKVGLFSNGQAFYLGKHSTAGSCTTNDRLRVTINTSTAGIYTALNKIAIYMSTQGSTVQVLIERALESTPTTFVTHKDWTGISGWSGWNILNISSLTTYGNTAASQYGRIRFTFRATAVNTTYSAALITKIQGYGGQGWTVPSNMAASGHLYSYDSSQNATFPNKVTATGGFSGALTGNVTGTATGNLTSVQYDSTNAKLTYTKNGSNTDIVTVATLKSALGSMPASDVYSWAKASTKPSYTASEVGAAASSHAHGNITSGGDITATAPTIASGDQIIINDNSASKVTNGPTFDGSTTTTALTPKGTWETFSKTDEKLKIEAVSAGYTYYPIVALNSTAAAARQYDATGLSYYQANGTTSAIGSGQLILGNSTASGTANNKEGKLQIYGSGNGSATIHATPNTNGHNWQFYLPLGLGATDTKINLVAALSYDAAVGSSTKPVYVAEGGLVAECNSYPTTAGSKVTGISIGNHSTGSITGVQSTTTTASKVTLGTAKSVPNVTSAGSASTWVFEDVTVPIRNDSATSIPNVTSVGSASTWSFSDITVPIRADSDTTVPIAGSAVTVPIKNSSATSIPNVTAVGSGSFTSGAFSGGSGSFSATVTNHVLSFSHTHTAATHGADSHTHTAPTLGTAISIIGVQSSTTSVTGVSGSTTVRGVKTGTSSTTTASKASGSNGTAPTLGTAISIYGVKSGTSSTVTASHVKSGGNGTAPTLGTAISIPNVTGVTDVTVPIKNTSATTVVTSATHSITDNGHTHTLS